MSEVWVQVVTVISTFAGCGGSSLGYQMAGFKELLAVEWDNNAVTTFRLNFPDVPIYHGDICKLSGEECMRLAGIKTGELDVLDGSPPCQGFSTAGKRQYSDPRNSLFKEYARLLTDLQPQVFVMENVTGMVKGYMKQAYLEIVQTLRGCGYRVKGQILNAMYYGVPQSRQRVILVGTRNDLGIEPSHPKPRTQATTMRECCWDLRGNRGDDRMLSPLLLKVAQRQPHIWSTNSRIYASIKGNLGSSLTLKWADWDKPCQTIIKDERALTGVVHPDRERYISLIEAKRIASYPDDFQFTDRKNGITLIGNSVPPLLMKAIAEHIRDKILIPTPTLQEVPHG